MRRCSYVQQSNEQTQPRQSSNISDSRTSICTCTHGKLEACTCTYAPAPTWLEINYEPECSQEHNHKCMHAVTRASTEDLAHRHAPIHPCTHMATHSRARSLSRAANKMQIMARMRAHRKHYAPSSTTSHALARHFLAWPAFNPGRRENEMHNPLSHADWLQTSS